MRQRLFNSRPCFLLRRNSDGTSLVQFTPPPRTEGASVGSTESFAPFFKQYERAHAWTDSDGNPRFGFEQATVLTKLLQKVTLPTTSRLPFVEPLLQMRYDAYRNDKGLLSRDDKEEPVYQ